MRTRMPHDSFGRKVCGSLTTISEKRRQDVPRIIRQLGMTQRDVAATLRLTPGAISRFLSVGPTHAPLRPERVEELVECLKRRLAQLEDYGSRGIDEVSEPTAALPLLSPETVRALRAELDRLLVNDDDEIAVPLPQVLATPGGPMPVNASNYVDRAADHQIAGILSEGHAPANMVVAPINGGASSFLNRVYRAAQTKSDCWVGMVQMDAAFFESEKFSQFELFQHFFRKIGVPVSDAGDDDEDALKSAFDSWARVVWKNVSRAVLIIDGLDEVFKGARPSTKPLALFNWLNALRLEAALGVVPYTKLAVFLALTGRTWNAAHSSPYATQAASLYLGKFSRNEVEQLFAKLNISTDAAAPDGTAVIDLAFDLFHGHPYLTQLFAHSIRNLSGPDDAKDEALNLEGSYAPHWERMKQELLDLLDNIKLEDLFCTVIYVTKPDKKLDEQQRKIWRSYHRALRVLGLLDGTSSQPELCKFYRTAIENELKMLEPRRLLGHAHEDTPANAE